MLNLPADSAFAYATGGWWTPLHEMLAGANEIGYERFRVLLALAGVKRHRLPPSITIYRPTVHLGPAPITPTPKPRRHASTVDEVIAVMRAGHR